MSVEKRVIAILRDHLGIAEDRITPDLFIMGEIDSPDHVELIMELEEEFDITIPDEEATEIQTVAQAIHYVEEHPGRSKGKGDAADPARFSGPENPLWDRELDGS
jgi:acyl carrier protein